MKKLLSCSFLFYSLLIVLFSCPAFAGVPVTGVELDRERDTLQISNPIVILTATVHPNNATNKNVEWSTTNFRVANVIPNNNIGEVVINGAGSATITVRTVDGSFTANYYLVVETGPVLPVLPQGTPSNIFPSFPWIDRSDIPGILTETGNVFLNEDIHINNNLVTLRSDISKGMAEELLSVNSVNITALPFLYTMHGRPDNIIAIGYQVKGSSLLTDRPERVKAFKALSTWNPNAGVPSRKGAFFEYESNPARFGDKKFTVQDIDNNIFTGTILPNNIYKLVFMIEHRGEFNIYANKDRPGFNWLYDPIALVSVPVTGVLISPDLTIQQGDTFDLNTRLRVLPASASNPSVTWRSENPAVASVNDFGIVTGVTGGIARIVVTTVEGNFTGYCDVTVLAPHVPVTNITGVPTTVILGTPLGLTGTVEPSNATNKTIMWSVANAGNTGATISGGNMLNVTAGGTVVVKATVVNGATPNTDYTKDFSITVFVPVTGIADLPTTVILGTPLALTGTVVPNDATNKTILWSVQNAGMTGATISGGNTLNVTAGGTAVIRARIVNGLRPDADFIHDFNISVFIPVTGITDLPTTVILGTPLTLTGTVVPTNATNRTITWSVQNQGGTGAVISDGNILNVTSAGTVAVRATVENGRTPNTNYTQEFNITVFVPVTGITNVPMTVIMGTPLALTGTVVPSNANNRTITWSVQEQGGTGAVISGGNMLSVTSTGTVVVRATIVNGRTPNTNYTQDFNISVFVPVTGITGVPTTIVLGTPLTLTGTVVPNNANNRTITWSVQEQGGTGAVISNGNILNVTSAGTARVRGTVVDGATPNTNFTQDFNITVFVPVTGIIGIPTTATAGVPLTLTGTVVPDNATNKSITWSIQNAGTTGATINGSTFNATSAGTVLARATVINGAAVGTDFMLDFNIIVNIQFVPVTDITGLPTAATAGVPLTLTGTVVPDNATNKSITWSVQNAGTTGATISGNTLNTISAGNVLVRATVIDGTAVGTNYTKDFSIDVSLQFVPVTDITGLPTAATAGVPLTLTGTVVPDNATNKGITWSVQNAGTTGATISGNTLNATAAGTVLVRATVINGTAVGTNYTKDFSIDVSLQFVPVTDITGIPTAATAGIPLTLTGTVVPDNATNKSINWSVQNAGTTGATISGNTLNTTSAGTVLVRATVIDGAAVGTNYTKDFSIDVSLTFIPVTGIIGVPTTATAGTPLTLTGTVVPSNATNQSINWSVQNAGTTGATISGNTLNATAAGTVLVRATVVDGTAVGANFILDFSIDVNEILTFVPVTNITGVPTAATAGTPLTLTGTVVPSNATNQSITWSVQNAGTTGATISGNTLNTTAAGTVLVRATVIDGVAVGTDFTQDFSIVVNDILTFMPVVSIVGVPTTAYAGIPLTLTGNVIPSNATNQTITWTVQAAGSTGATISGDILNTTNEGAVTVRATIVNGRAIGINHMQNFTITVNSDPNLITGMDPYLTTGVILNKTYLSLHVGSSETLTATVFPNGAADKRVVWSSNNPWVASVNASGLVTAIGPGYATITARTVDGIFEATCILSVTTPVSRLAINPSNVTLNSGEMCFLTVDMNPINVSNSNVVWSSSNSVVATVNQGGWLTAVGGGVATITATAVDGSGIYGTCNVYVIAPAIFPTETALNRINEIIPEQPVLPAGTPVAGIVTAEPIIIIPDDILDISLETDMLGAMMPGIEPEDLRVNEHGIITVKEWIAKEIAEVLLGADNAEVIALPVFEAVLNNPGDTAAISFRVKGRHLMVNGLISRPEDVRLLKVLSASNGDWFTYTDTASGLKDKTFTILDATGSISTDDLIHDGDYKLLFLIKDGGDFDLDMQTDAAVWGVLVLVGAPASPAELNLP